MAYIIVLFGLNIQFNDVEIGSGNWNEDLFLLLSDIWYTKQQYINEWNIQQTNLLWKLAFF